MAELLANRPYQRGETLLLDRELRVDFVRVLGNGDAVVSFAGGNQAVPLTSLSRVTP